MLHNPWNILLVLLSSLFPHGTSLQVPLTASTNTPLRFELRHLHALANSSRIVFADVPALATQSAAKQEFAQEPYYTVHTKSLRTYRPNSLAAHANARAQSRLSGRSSAACILWDDEEILAPDVERREVLQILAKMTNNAYLRPDEKGWYDLGDVWSPVRSF